MKKGWTANTWVLVICSTILLLVGVDIGRRYVVGAKALPPEEPKPTMQPDFKVGDLAPEFTLPDAAGKKHTLAELVKDDTLLCFVCGCAACRDLQTGMASLLKKLGPKAPKVVSVATIDPESEKAYVRDTGLQQKLVYDGKDKKVMDLYRGHPCPRVFRITPERKVAWISPSPAEVPEPGMIYLEVAQNLGVSGYPEAPITMPAAASGHGPGDGHDHGPGDGHDHGPGDGHAHGPGDGHGH